MLLRNLYDSHVHLMSTGELKSWLDLSVLKSPAGFAALEIRPENRRGDWIVGFGWDENQWDEKRWPHRADLDGAFPDTPVYFSRCDGHSAITNTAGLKRLGLWSDPADPPGGQIIKDADGVPTGRLTETAHDACLAKLPAATPSEMAAFLVAGARKFNEAGFTHVRDMAASEALWNVATDLERDGRLSLHVEWNFTCENLQGFARALDEARRCRDRETRLNKVAGVKFYFDGSLGSDTAYLSQPYAHRQDGSRGLTCWNEDDVEQAIRRAWGAGLPVAVHAIGDLAADRVVELARRVSSAGVGGRLNLEHAEVLRAETIQKMKGLHVTCHLQPCHWLSDRQWLDRKLGALKTSAFPWEALRRAKIPFHFGSDSPIERPSLFDNLRALRESAQQGIPALQADPLSFHVHPDPRVVPGETSVDGDRVRKVTFDGRVVFTDGE